MKTKLSYVHRKEYAFMPETLDPDVYVYVYRKYETSVLRSIKVFRFLTPVVEHLKPKLRKRGKEDTGVFK